MTGGGGSSGKKQAIAALNVYKKIAIVRHESDTLSYEDEHGNVQTVANLGAAAASSVSYVLVSVVHPLVDPL